MRQSQTRHITSTTICVYNYMNGGSGLVRQYLLLQVLLLDHLQGKVLSELVDATRRRLYISY